MIDKILNFEQAKEFYFTMVGSYFGMWKEEPELFKQYSNLNIPKSIESEWHKEYFDKQVKDILSAESEEFGWKFSGLVNIIKRDKYYVQEAFNVLKLIYNKVPADQIIFILNALIGINATSSHGGLIEMAFKLKLKEIAISSYNYAKYFLECAKKFNISLFHIKSNLVDVIKYYNIKEDKTYINMLIDEDNLDKFNYHLEGALKDNIFSMIMLANQYLHGIGCIKNIDEAINWYKYAASKGSIEAEAKYNKLTQGNIVDKWIKKIFS